MPDKYNKNYRLGEEIKRIRLMKKLSQGEIARRTGMKREYLSRIESGDIKNPTLSTIHKLADGLEIRISELLEPEEFFKPKVRRIKIISGSSKRERVDEKEEIIGGHACVPILDSSMLARNINYINENDIKDYALVRSDCLEPTDDQNRYLCAWIKTGNEHMHPVLRSNSLICIDSHQRNPDKLAGCMVALRKENGDCLVIYLKIYLNKIVGIAENFARFDPVVIPLTKNSPILGKIVWYWTTLP